MRSIAYTTGRTGRVALSASVAAVALTFVANEAHAQSNDACGPLADGQVICSPAVSYPKGLQYYSQTGDAISVILDGDFTLAPDNRYVAVDLISEGGSLSLTGPDANISTRNASGVAARTYGDGLGDITIDIGDITAILDGGAVIRGVETVSVGGLTSIKVGNVLTGGDQAVGISAVSSYGAISVNAGSVLTTGADAHGVYVSSSGDMDVRVGRVETSGDYAVGIAAEGGLGRVSITADSVQTGGFAADAIGVASFGDISVDVNEITGTGDYIWGVNALNGGLIDDQLFSGASNITIGSIDLTGDNNVGVALYSYADAFVNVGDLKLDGEFGSGTVVLGVTKAIVQVGTATFTGLNSGGIAAQSDGDAHVSVGSLTAEYGSGVAAQAFYGRATADVGSIKIGGDFVAGVDVATISGDAAVRVGSVETTGEFDATGVRVQAMQGVATANVGSIRTNGELSRGLVVFGGETQIVASGAIATGGDFSDGILTSTTAGDAVVRTAGPVFTTGSRSNGLWVVGRYGLADIHALGQISTQGELSHGILAEGENGEVSIGANEISTAGAGSDGIHARTKWAEVYAGQPDIPPEHDFTGDIDIRASKISVTGTGSSGIDARGVGGATILAGDVFARDGYAVFANMIGEVKLDLRGGAQSAQGTAVSLQGETLDVRLGTSGRIEGALDAIVLTAGARCVLPNPEDGVSVNPCPNPGADSGYIPVPYPLQPIEFGGRATVVNDGAVLAGSGHAIRMTDGALALTNNGRMRGSLLLAEGDDVVDNRGLFELTATSDFGAGLDVFWNSGELRLIAGTAAKSVALQNLERFENSGLVELRNGVAGDTLTVSGDFVGAGGSTIALDVDVAGAKSDRLVVGGAATGSTRLVIKGEGDQAQLTGADGVVVVEAGAGSSATAFTLDPDSDRGFIGYDLTYDVATRRFAVRGTAGAAAYRQVGALQAADTVWSSAADAWRTTSASARDAAFAGEDAGRVWAMSHAGEASRDWASTPAGARSTDLDYRQTQAGGQFGYDLVSTHSEGRLLRAGITAGYGQSELEYRLSGDRFDLSSFNLGAYVAATRGRAFGEALVKYDAHDIDIQTTAMAQGSDVDSVTWGVDAQTGYRFGDAGLFIEPAVGVRWTRTSQDDLVNGGQVLAFEDADDISARLGLRVGSVRPLGGDTITLHAGAHVVHHFGDDYQLGLIAGQTQALLADRAETYGQATFGATYRTSTGFEGFAESQGDLGSGYDALTARIGVRVRF